MTDILPPKVLFVDDDRAIRVAFANAARALGIEAEVADSGGQALELAQQSAFPVVVTDLRMPGIDGVALIERLSALDPTTAFVLVSAAPDLQASLPGIAHGAITTVLNKPFDMPELQETLARAFAHHQRRTTQGRRSLLHSGWSILVVEDSPGDAELLKEYLSPLPNLTLVQVSSVKEALELVHDLDFEAIITDLNLPDAHGFDAVLRLQSSSPDSAILAYSGSDDEALALQVVQLGAQDFLPKRTTTQDALLRSLRFAHERKRSEIRLRRLAHYDQLTGLANRAAFVDTLDLAVARALRQDRRVAVMMIDLDGFKQINDNLGHEAGDHVLQEIGVRMRCLFREYDVVARFGGDEFAVLLSDVQSTAALAEISARLLDALALPIGVKQHRVTCSMGIAVFPDAGRTPTRLLRSADMAMYKAKHNGKNRYEVYDGPVPATTSPRPPAPTGDLPSGSRLIAARLPRDLLEDSEDPAVRERAG